MRFDRKYGIGRGIDFFLKIAIPADGDLENFWLLLFTISCMTQPANLDKDAGFRPNQ